ncbi:MAG: PfkB family carbohydrate kinase [Candidatus Omnitrophota bacterium]
MSPRRSIVVIGSVAIDSVETPFGRRDNVLGGSATYFSLASRMFNDVNIVATVGKDFPKRFSNVFTRFSIGTDGLTVGKGDTFAWKGRYGVNINEAQTIYTRLNVFEKFKPVIPVNLKNSRTIFLANIDPVLQADVLTQVKRPALTACDTMNFWIDQKKKELLNVFKKVDLVLLNETEAKTLSGEKNLIRASRWIISKGPKMVAVKKGENGVFFSNGSRCFLAPAFPLETLKDPTGAGDSFAGGMVGYLSTVRKINESAIRKAIIYGSVLGSFCVEDFSVNRLIKLKKRDIIKRYTALRRLTAF